MNTEDSSGAGTGNNEQEIENKFQDRLTKQIARGGGESFFGKLFGKGIKFFFQILLTRTLGASPYGLYTLGKSVLSISQSFSKMGLHSGVVRFGSIHRGEDDHARLKGTLLMAIVLSFFSGILIGFGLYFASGLIANQVFHEPELEFIIKLFALSLPFKTLMIVTAHSARVFRQMRFDVGVRNVTHPLSLVALAGISLLLGYGLHGVMFAFLCSSIFSAFVGLYFVWYLFPKILSDLTPTYEFRKVVFFSVTVLLLGFSSLLLTQTDRIMLGVFDNVKGVGVYNAAAIIAMQMLLFPSSIQAIFSPIIADLYNQDKINKLGFSLKLTTRWKLTSTIPLYCVCVIFSVEIMRVFGSEFAAGWSSLIVLTTARILSVSVGEAGNILVMTGHEKTEFANNLLLGLLNIGLNILFIKKYGIVGAAYGTGLSLLLVNGIRLFEMYLLIGIHPYDTSLLKPVFCGVASSAILFSGIYQGFLTSGFIWLLGVVAFGLIYLFFLFLVGLEETDKLVLKAVKHKLLSLMANEEAS